MRSTALYSRIMLTGKNGQVGWELQRTLAPLGEVIALDRHKLDLANHDQIRELVREIKPDLIVNAAAYTAVDLAESETDLAMEINGVAPGILAEEAKHIGAAIIHYSTDYVFDGNKTTPYTEEDTPNPINVYGRTKLAGERAIRVVGVPHLILRTSWVYGKRGKNFFLTILRLAREREELKIVDDQIGAPTWSRMVAEATSQLIASNGILLKDMSEIYHLSAGGQTSWYGFAKEISRYALPNVPHTAQVCGIPTAEYPSAACRPKYSVLSNTKLRDTFGIVLPDWEKGLNLMFDQHKYL